jgi:hypothetical protein
MRPRYRPPRKKRYFHTKPKIDKRDMTILKKKVDFVKQDKEKKDAEERFIKKRKRF